jgi:hypothetical protein
MMQMQPTTESIAVRRKWLDTPEGQQFTKMNPGYETGAPLQYRTSGQQVAFKDGMYQDTGKMYQQPTTTSATTPAMPMSTPTSTPSLATSGIGGSQAPDMGAAYQQLLSNYEAPAAGSLSPDYLTMLSQMFGQMP